MIIKNEAEKKYSSVVILNSKFVTLGTLEPVLIEKGFSITVYDATTDNISAIDPDNADLMVILGGPQSPYETDKYPYLQGEIDLLSKRLLNDRPTLGIALGAQLIASALGEKVYPGKEKDLGVEINWGPLVTTPEGQRAALDIFTEDSAKVLTWQNDGYDLPADCVSLAEAGAYGNQAFQYKNNCLALQFHAEVTLEILTKWMDLLDQDFKLAGIDKEVFRYETEKYVGEMGKKASRFWQTWIDLVLGNNSHPNTLLTSD